MPTRDDDPFRKILSELVGQLPGAHGAIFVDWEGEAVELFARTGDEYEMKLAGAEVGLLLQRAVSVSKEAGLGRTTSMLVATERSSWFLQTLDEEYFVLLVTDPEVLPGLARARLSRALIELRRHV